MAASSIAVLTLGVTAAANLTKYRAVTDAGAVPSAAARCLGFVQNDVTSGDRAAVVVQGTCMAEAGAAIAAAAAVELDSSGRVVTKSAGVTVGRVAPGYTAGASGDVVEIVLLPS